MADGYLSRLRSHAEDARDTAEDYGRRRNTLHDRGGDARGEVSRLWSDLEDLVERRIGPAATGAARSASGYAREGRDMALDVADHVRHATRSRPLMAIGIAVAATWFISSILHTKR
jgi:hypothetical protein